MQGFLTRVSDLAGNCHNKGGMGMDLQSVKYGLGIAASCMTGIVVLFALYVKMGASAQKKTGKRD